MSLREGLKQKCAAYLEQLRKRSRYRSRMTLVKVGAIVLGLSAVIDNPLVRAYWPNDISTDSQRSILVAICISVVLAVVIADIAQEHFLIRPAPFRLLLEFYRRRDDASPHVSAKRAYRQCLRLGDYPRVFDAARLFLEYHLWGLTAKTIPVSDFVTAWLSDTGGKQPPSKLTVPNLFAITDQEDLLHAYFQAVMNAEPKSDTRDRFLSEMTVENGYLAYQQLLDGMLATYDERWDLLIQQFIQECNDNCGPKFAQSGFQRSQLYIFYCWFLWGPSVPIGACSQWCKSKTLPILALQYGFGDECNSLPVTKLVNEADDDDHFHDLVKHVASSPFAVDMGLAVRPVFLPKQTVVSTKEVQDSLNALGAAQSQLFRSVASRRDGTVLLDYRSARWVAGSEKAADPRKYYSAYIWIMFVLVDAKSGAPVFPVSAKSPKKTSHAWHGLFPFFEHGNIADDSTYALFKYQLAAKALSSISRLIKEPYNQNDHKIVNTRDYRFRYACASDDANCMDQICQAHQSSFSPKLKSAVFIKDHIKQLLGAGEQTNSGNDWNRYGDLKDVILMGDNGDDFANEQWEEHRGEFSACHLPDIIETFYSYIDNQSESLNTSM